MAYEQKDGQGTLFKNKRKETEKHPDYTGSITINGTEHWLSAWIKDGKSGKFMSLSLGKPKEQRGETYKKPSDAPADNFGDSEIPF